MAAIGAATRKTRQFPVSGFRRATPFIPPTKRHVRPAGDQDEDFAPELFSSAAPTD
jgi:hypothetical protein